MLTDVPFSGPASDAPGIANVKDSVSARLVLSALSDQLPAENLISNFARNKTAGEGVTIDSRFASHQSRRRAKDNVAFTTTGNRKFISIDRSRNKIGAIARQEFNVNIELSIERVEAERAAICRRDQIGVRSLRRRDRRKLYGVAVGTLEAHLEFSGDDQEAELLGNVGQEQNGYAARSDIGEVGIDCGIQAEQVRGKN